MTEKLLHWAIVDLNVFRRIMDDLAISRARTINNLDGTEGKIFDLRLLPHDGLIAASDTVKVAIASGLDAVERPSDKFTERELPPKPPDLQLLIARFGGYNNITPDGWAEWEQANAAYREQRQAYYHGLHIR